MMIQRMLGNFLSLRPLSLFVLLPLLTLNGFMIKNVAEKVDQIAMMQNGVQTCFTRINQTFTAKMIGNGVSEYLSDKFLEATEECIAEAQYVAEGLFAGKDGLILKKINALSTDTHWFHRKMIDGGVEKTGGIVVSNVAPKYQGLETIKDALIEILASQRTLAVDSLFLLKIAFGFLILMFSLILGLDFFKSKARLLANESSEIQAKVLVEGEFNVEKRNIELILSSALKDNDLYFCNRLFDCYIQKYDKAFDSNVFLESVQDDSEEREEQIERIWSSESGVDVEKRVEGKMARTIENQKCTNVSNPIEQTIELFTQKIQALGISVAVEVHENLEVQGDKEILEHIFYNAIVGAMDRSESGASNEKKISVKSHVLGGTILLEIENTGNGFNGDFLANQSGLLRKKDDLTIEIGLKICEEFMKDIDGAIEYENILSGQSVVGARMKLYFRGIGNKKKNAEIKTGVQVAQILKGSRNDVLEKIRAQI